MVDIPDFHSSLNDHCISHENFTHHDAFTYSEVTKYTTEIFFININIFYINLFLCI